MPSRMTGGKPRIAVFSRVSTLRERVEAIIRMEPDLEWAASTDRVGSAVKLVQQGHLDVILIDSASDPGWRLCLLLNRLFPETAVVAVFAEEPADMVDSAWAVLHGARGLVRLGAEARVLPATIRRTVNSNADLSPWLRAQQAAVPQRSDRLTRFGPSSAP
jgi:DNA-binding NarL/FixJ family response regulator